MLWVTTQMLWLRSRICFCYFHGSVWFPGILRASVSSIIHIAIKTIFTVVCHDVSLVPVKIYLDYFREHSQILYDDSGQYCSAFSDFWWFFTSLAVAPRGVAKSLRGCEKSILYKILHRSSDPKKFPNFFFSSKKNKFENKKHFFVCFFLTSQGDSLMTYIKS